VGGKKKKEKAAAMATPPARTLDTKNPGGLAGHTGVGNDLAGQQDREEAYNGPGARSSGFDLAVWSAACDSLFDRMERTARIIDAYRVLAELLPDNDNYPAEWIMQVVSS